MDLWSKKTKMALLHPQKNTIDFKEPFFVKIRRQPSINVLAWEKVTKMLLMAS